MASNEPASEEGVPGTIWYLSRLELYRKQKPFMVTFDTSTFEGSKKTNHLYESYPTRIVDMRAHMGQYKLNLHGFEVCHWDTPLVSNDFDDENILREKYYPEIASQLQKHLAGVSTVHVFQHLRRKTPKGFMKALEKEPDYHQPIIYAHADFSTRGAEVQVESFFRENEHLRGRRWEIINAWRVTKGPNNDWPLAVCDARTVSREDVEQNDVIHRTHVGESLRLYHNPKHKWHFLSSQEVTEVVLFRNASSKELQLPVGFHSAVTLGPQKSADLRESIEIRMLCIF
ncbi:hypothetical protein TWF225_010986 [Orbilia oligospora]|uniref:Uncharacterized protein n=1 Tax=Orbilia oligospora TaxID=2813651 RepID=A0A7C8K5A5_ORBOL|nr:hypothetical protein TWF751_009814 [Orbilia oligospora]KAF3193144.1 hypothetical protein TWF225_010986 [Orbilia oligospora]KAF3265697.1 hypothetical protein TWF217_002240 [Orbilia oligospora]KAF3271607.1 hypothetical protein TWF128_000177 [Orbilia oligospora]KAF3295097.1 hypothetical protein TWF132_002417 [Orbilia oligospora]